MQQHNGDISSILQSFDTITYCKGASVLRMLCHCVGPSRFLEGTRRFVVDHQYACATQEDLWRAVQVRLEYVLSCRPFGMCDGVVSIGMPIWLSVSPSGVARSIPAVASVSFLSFLISRGDSFSRFVP